MVWRTKAKGQIHEISCDLRRGDFRTQDPVSEVFEDEMMITFISDCGHRNLMSARWRFTVGEKLRRYRRKPQRFVVTREGALAELEIKALVSGVSKRYNVDKSSWRHEPYS